MTYTAAQIPNSLNMTDSQSTLDYLQKNTWYVVIIIYVYL